MVGLIPLKYNQKFLLKQISVECSIRNLLVSCKSEFVYKNDEDEDIEALFSFPLDNNCVVYYLEAVIGNKTIIAVCKEIEEAKNMYKVAKEMGHATALIERKTNMRDVFNCRIGNFPKNSEAKIILKFAMELKLSLARSEVKGVDRMDLALPLILRPRYTPTVKAILAGSEKSAPEDSALIAHRITQTLTQSDSYSTNFNDSSVQATKKFLAEQVAALITIIKKNSRPRDRSQTQRHYRGRSHSRGYEGDREIFPVENKYVYHFKANVTGTKAICDISSVNHSLGISYTNNTKTSAEIILQSEYDGTKDLDIHIDYAEIREPSVFYELGTKSDRYKGAKVNGAFYQPNVAMINFLPKFDQVEPTNQQKLEIIFVVDRSGSMRGSNIARAQECLLIFLKSLPVNCKFQIYGFGSTFDKAFNDPQLYSDHSINIALNYQKNLDANFGGTELMQPLRDLYNAPVGSDYARVVFLLTDGDVGNQDEVTSLVRKHNKTTRLYSVGIGDGVSTSLVDQVAQAGLGKSAFVRNARELSASVMELLDIAINCNSFADTKVEWKCPEHVSIISVPTIIPPIFSDYFLTVFCMINGMRTNDTIQCILSGNVDGKRVSFSMEINDSGAITDEEFRVHRLLAKYKIDELTVQIEGGQEDLKKTLIEISTDINIVTDWTTFVAIDQDAPQQALSFDEPLVNIVNRCRMKCLAPVAGPVPMHHRRLYGAGAPVRSMLGGAMPIEPMFGGASNADSFFLASRIHQNVSSSDKNESQIEKENETDKLIISFVQKQNINGSWNYDENLFIEMGLDLNEVKNNKPANVSDGVWATIIIHQFLVTKLQSREKEWRLFGKKARQWVESSLNNPDLLKIAFEASLQIVKE